MGVLCMLRRTRPRLHCQIGGRESGVGSTLWRLMERQLFCFWTRSSIFRIGRTGSRQNTMRLSGWACRSGLWPVGHLPCRSLPERASRWLGASKSSGRVGAAGGDREENHGACAAAFVCDALAGGRGGYPDGAGVARPQRCEHDDDLHTCAEPTRCRSAKSAGWVEF